MPNILRLNKISPLANKIFPKDFTLTDECANPDGIILRSFKMHEYALPASVTCVARAGAGVNNIPIDKCSEKGIVVFNTPGANANAVKELVICSLFLCGRKITDGINWAGSLKGQGEVAKKIEDGKSAFTGHEIMGKSIGLIGLGAIGLLAANAALSLGMQVYGYDPYLSPANAAKLDKNIKIINKLEELYPLCDYLSLHVPLADSTRGMINAASIALCRDGVNIINCARGELGNNADIIAAVQSGKINRYVTDFPTDEVLGVPNIITIPHLGASTPEAEDNCAIMATEQLVDFINNGNIINSVNFPAVRLDRCDCKCKRITVAYKGELDIKANLDKIGIKPCGFACGKRGELCYAIFDVDNADKAKEIEKLNGVLRVRVI